MIDLDFGELGGGKKTFRDRATIGEFLQRQRSAWMEDQDLANFMAGAGSNAVALRGLGEAWAKLATRVEAAATQYPDLDATFQGAAQTHIDNAQALSLHSAIGAEIKDIAMTLGAGAAVTAINYVRAKPNDFPLQNASKLHLDVSHRMWAVSNSIDTEAAKKARAAVRRSLADLERLYTEHHVHLEGIEADHRATYEQWVAELTAERTAFAEYREQVAGAVTDDRDRWQSEWTNQFKLYTEQLKLKAAVTRWDERAAGHEASYKRQRYWVIGIGAGGLVAAVLWSWAALSLAHWLFSDALVVGPQAAAPGTLRPTWIHELIFAASASLLYLTMFLWTMRVLVRMMMSEHHLGVDARSRASMAHTYLALLEDKGVTEDADRAIVLAALFRPVTDGLVKDDAMPLISPASILSGKLAGG